MHIPGQKPMLGQPLNEALPINEGLIAAYLNREKAPAGGRLLDDSGNGNPGTLAADADSVPGKFGLALRFDGLNDLVEIANGATILNGLTAVTLIMLIKSDAIATDDGFIDGNVSDVARGFNIRYDNAGFFGGGDDVIQIGIGDATGADGDNSIYESASFVQTTNWQHIGVTWQVNSAISLYINGVLDAPTFSTSNGGPIANLDFLRIGFHGKGNWTGKISNILIYERVLSAREIMSLKWDPYQGWAEDAFETTVGGIIVPAAPAGGIVVLRRRIEAA